MAVPPWLAKEAGLFVGKKAWGMTFGAQPSEARTPAERQSHLDFLAQDPAKRASMMDQGLIPSAGPAADVGRPALGADLTAAAEGVMAARERDINRQLAQAMRRMDIQYGASGVYRSGERLAMGRQFEQAAIRDIEAERQRVGLQQAGLEQQARLGERQLSLQEAALKMQAQQAKAPLYAAAGNILGNLFIDKLPALLSKIGIGGMSEGAQVAEWSEGIFGEQELFPELGEITWQ